ncbi:FAD-dependent oxidoreductase [bacterium]|nr:FAD-dependent oxidoreductase [bacterium]
MKVVIVGGGVTGLSLAFLLTRAGVTVEVLEASDRVGGLLNTFDVGNGKRLEYFYHHFFTHDVEINWLLQQLGLDSDVSYVSSTMGIYRNDRVYDFNGIRDLASFNAMSLSGRLRFGLSSALLAYRKKYTNEEHQTALNWFYRNAGNDATDAVWRPMLEVKFGDKADQIPLAWIAGRLRQRVLSRRAGKEKLGYLSGSLQKLTDKLTQRLRELGVEIRLNCPVKSIDKRSMNRSGNSEIQLASGDCISDADQIVVTTPTTIASNFFQKSAPQYSKEISEIEYLGAICTVLSLPEKLSDIYWTNIADGNCDFGGVIEQTNLVDSEHYDGQHLVYLSKYAALEDPIWNLSDEELVSRQMLQLESIYKKPIRSTLNHSWVFRTKTAAPLTDVGFRDRVPEFSTPVKDVFLASMCHLYPEERSVNNSIRVAAEVAAEMGFDQSAKMVPMGISDAGKIGRGNVHRSLAKAA